MKILGHRGARNEHPENTLGSFERALRAGAEGVECDVHLTKDGRVVVIHDDTLERTTNGRGRISEKTLAELKALDAGKSEKIPTLEELLDLVRGRATPFIELKGQGVEPEVVRLVRAAGLEGQAWVKAFDHRKVLRSKQLAPALRAACLLVARPVDPVGLARAAQADGLSIQVDHLDEELVRTCHAAGLVVCGWNVNDPARLPSMRAMQLDWLGTDEPTKIAPLA